MAAVDNPDHPTDVPCARCGAAVGERCEGRKASDDAHSERRGDHASAALDVHNSRNGTTA